MRLITTLPTILLLVACSIKQDIVPVTFAPTAERSICIIEHRATRQSFLDSYQRALQERGFETRVVPQGSSLETCPVMTTYLARWSWDMTIYMSYAQLQVYHNGQNVGRAVYDSRVGSFRMDKWVDADAKIRELVDQLFVAR